MLGNDVIFLFHDFRNNEELSENAKQLVLLISTSQSCNNANYILAKTMFIITFNNHYEVEKTTGKGLQAVEQEVNTTASAYCWDDHCNFNNWFYFLQIPWKDTYNDTHCYSTPRW